MLLIIAVLAILSAAFLLFRSTRRQANEFTVQPKSYFEPPPNARPLFEPSADELSRDADVQAAREIAQREYHASAAARDRIDSALKHWRAERDRSTAIELLNVTTQYGREGDFSRAADEVLKVFREDGIAGLADSDLAALLDSHVSLLSVGERSSGESFWLRQEVAKLRSR